MCNGVLTTGHLANQRAHLPLAHGQRERKEGGRNWKGEENLLERGRDKGSAKVQRLSEREKQRVHRHAWAS